MSASLVRVGWVERSDTQQRYAAIISGDGYRYAPPILRVLRVLRQETAAQSVLRQTSGQKNEGGNNA